MTSRLEDKLLLPKAKLRKLENGESLDLSIHYQIPCFGDKTKQSPSFKEMIEHAESYYREQGILYIATTYESLGRATFFACLEKEHVDALVKDETVILITR